MDRMTIALPMVLQGGPQDGATNGSEFSFYDKSYPPFVKLPGVLTDAATWRSAVYQRTNRTVRRHGVDCVVYQFSKYETAPIQVK